MRCVGFVGTVYVDVFKMRLETRVVCLFVAEAGNYLLTALIYGERCEAFAA